MELRHIRYFVAVAEELHFRKAAERLNISQPPLSQQIKQLENELGVELFVRNRRRVALTPAGRRFLLHARNVLDEVQRSVREAKSGEPSLSIGFVSSATAYLAPTLRVFRSVFPLFEIRLLEGSSTNQAEMLEGGQIDVGLVRPPIPGYDLEYATLARDNFVLVLPTDHPRAHEKALHLRSLGNERYVMFPRPLGPGIFDAVTTACRKVGFSPDILDVAGSVLTIIRLVAAGQGISIVPSSVAKTSSDIVYRELPDLHEESILAAAYTAGREDEPQISAFLSIVRELGHGFSS